MDLVESIALTSTTEETARQPASMMVVGRDKEEGSSQIVFASPPLLPGKPPTLPDVFRRLQNDSLLPVLTEGQQHGGVAINTFNICGEETDVQEQAEALIPFHQNQNLTSPVTELGSNIQYSQQCTEDIDGSFQYLEGKHWSKGIYIGGGASGSCYKAVDHKTNSVIVVKQISMEFGKEDDVDSEINIMNSVHHHPNMVSFFGTTRDHHIRNIFMEWVKGGSLEAKLKRDGPFDEDIIWRYSRQVVCGLQFLHNRGIAHRDLKGANVLLDPDLQTIRIADFGTAARLTEAKKFHKVAGTPPFMAPEVVRATVAAGYGLKCDVWSLGCMLIEMSTTRPPWVSLDRGYNRWEVLYKIGSSDTPPTLPNFHSTGLRDLVVRCLQVNPNNRPTSLEL